MERCADRDARLVYAWQLTNTLERNIIEQVFARPLSICVLAGGPQDIGVGPVNGDSKHALRLESVLERRNSPERLHKEARTDKEDNGWRCLYDRERLPQPRSPAAAF